MIKRITKLLNNRVINQKPYRFGAKKQGDDNVTDIDPEIAEEIKQQIQQAVQDVQGTQLQAGQTQIAQSIKEVAIQFDDFEGVNLVDSNWRQLASLVHTGFYLNKKDPQLYEQVSKKLNQIQQIYGFDINNLDRLKILEQKQFDLRSSISAVSNDSSRYLENTISDNSKIGYGTMKVKRFLEMIQSKNIPAMIQTYRNNEYKYFNMQTDFIQKIQESVLSTNFETQYLLNYFEFFTITEKEKQPKSNKNFDKILQNLHNLNDVNKLKFYRSLPVIFENGFDLINYNDLCSELSKIGFQGINEVETEKLLKLIYNATLGREPLKKLINYSLNKFSTNFEEFLLFWGLFNLLITKLYSLNETSIVNPANLNNIFQLFDLNFSQPKQIIAQIIPEVLYQTKNKSLFEIYRLHTKFWIEKKHSSSDFKQEKGPYDDFINNKIEFQDSIKIVYNGWNSENAAPTVTTIRTNKNFNNKNLDRKDELLSETKMIEHLIRGDYSFVLNNFLLVFNPGLDKSSFSTLKNIIRSAQDMEFDSQNTKALYILKNINEKFQFLAEPVSFRKQFMTNFKKVKWLEKSDQYKKQKMFQRNSENIIVKSNQKHDDSEPIQYVNRQKIRSKPKKYDGDALFSKKNKNLFSTQKDAYTQYRQVVKQVTETPIEFGFNFDSLNPDIKTFETQVERRSMEMNQNNHKALLKQNNLPIVGNGINLLKYLFLKKPLQSIEVDEKLKKKMKVNFVSEIGALQKDYSEYLLKNRFNFPLAEEIYISLLDDQVKNYNRRNFKTIVSHILAFRQTLSSKEVESICQTCNRNRIGITLIEIYSLIIQNKIIIPKQSIYTICDTLQKFKKINNDIFLLTKKYCENINIDFQIKMLSSFVKNLLVEEKDDKLNELSEMIKNELKLKPYKLKQNLSPDENLKLEKEYKELQKKQYNRVLFEIIDMIVLNVNNKLPAFISNLFDEYQKAQIKLNSKEIAISLIVYCNNVDKILEIIRSLKENKGHITTTTFECAIKAIKLNLRGLESHSEQIFNVALFTHNFILNEEQIQRSVQIFRILNTPTVFIKFLEYVLRYNPLVNFEIKSAMYTIMNNINDDFAKNTISGLLDFIFNSNRQKQREEYRKAQIVEEEKVKQLQDIEKKQIFKEDFEALNEKVEATVETGKQNKKQKKNKKQKQDNKQKIDNLNKTAQKDAKSSEKAMATENAKAKAPKAEKKRISLKAGEQFLQQNHDPVLKKSPNLKKKLRSKSLNDFEEMFTKKQEQLDEPAAAKGGKPQQQQKGTDKKVEKKGQKKK